MMSSTTSDAEPVREERYEVYGRVQGVGFRWWTRFEALRLGVTGSVRNRQDGSVEVRARGSSEALERLAERLERGPPPAHVEEVRRGSVSGVAHEGFEIIH